MGDSRLVLSVILGIFIFSSMGILSTAHAGSEIVPGIINVLKFHDLNGNGVQDAGEPGIEGWEISVNCESGSSGMELTDINGMTSFLIDDVPSDCTVFEEQRDGWIPTTETEATIFVDEGETEEVVFGNMLSGSIHVFGFEDMDADGHYEPPTDTPWDDSLPGKKIDLFDAGGNFIASQTTDATGQAWFTDLTPGVYGLQEDLAPFDLDGDGSLDNNHIMPSPDPDGSGDVPGGADLRTVTVNGGEALVWADGASMFPPGIQVETNLGSQLIFGNFIKGSIHVFGFLDEDNDGIQDANEGAFQDDPGKTFELIDQDGTVIETEFTIDGKVWFEQLVPGSYAVRENPIPGGFILTTLPNERTFTVTSGQELVYEDGASAGMLKQGQFETNIGNELRWGNGGIVDLEISKSSFAYAQAGDSLTYTIEVENLGPSDAQNVEVVDTLPSEVTFVSDTDSCTENPAGTLTCDLGALASGDIMSFEITVDTDSDIPIGTILSNFAEVNSDNYDPVPENNDDTADITILPKSIVTSSSLEVDGFDNFRIIYTNDPADPKTFKLTATNPGQTYYNVFATGDPGETLSLAIDIPAPYITIGSEPIHAYADVDASGGYYVPSNEIPVLLSSTAGLSMTPSGAYGIAENESGATMMIEDVIPETGLYYLTVHLDFGLKKTNGYIKAASTAINEDYTIEDGATYLFEVLCAINGDEISDSDTITSENDFKKFRGIAVYYPPAIGEEVNLEDEDGDNLESAIINDDGLAFIDFHHKGKQSNYNVVLNGLEQEITLSSKMPYAFVDFS